jgi:hypothetical protein
MKLVGMLDSPYVRPVDKQHAPWLERIQGQLMAACRGLEQAVSALPPLTTERPLMQTDITPAVAWQFIQSMLAAQVPERDYPALTALSRTAEARPEFLRYPPDGPGVQPATT